jgi:CBS domain-containing protein
MARIVEHVTRDVIALDGTAQCREAARLMMERKIGAVAVREGDRTIGLVTERDLVGRLVAAGGECTNPLREVMRRDVPTIAPDATEQECANLMRDHYTRHLLVADRDGQVVGIISMRDVIRLMIDEKQQLIEQLQAYISDVP